MSLNHMSNPEDDIYNPRPDIKYDVPPQTYVAENLESNRDLPPNDSRLTSSSSSQRGSQQQRRGGGGGQRRYNNRSYNNRSYNNRSYNNNNRNRRNNFRGGQQRRREPREDIIIEYRTDDIRMTGTVAWFHRKRGFGRIAPGNHTNIRNYNDIPTDDSVFVHRSQIANTSDRDPILLPGELVEYCIGYQIDNEQKSAAVKVTWPNNQPIARAKTKIAELSSKHPAAGGLVTGRVKWFNDQQGYGFITLDDASLNDTEKDIFVHRMDIAQGTSLLEGERVECFVRINTRQNDRLSQQGNSGAKAVNVTGPNGGRTRGRKQDLNIRDYQRNTLYYGHVKWFDRRKGYGYIIIDRSNDEIIVRRSQIENTNDSGNNVCLAEGERVEFYVEEDREDRPIATQVTGPNDSAVVGMEGIPSNDRRGRRNTNNGRRNSPQNGRNQRGNRNRNDDNDDNDSRDSRDNNNNNNNNRRGSRDDDYDDRNNYGRGNQRNNNNNKYGRGNRR